MNESYLKNSIWSWVKRFWAIQSKNPVIVSFNKLISRKKATILHEKF